LWVFLLCRSRRILVSMRPWGGILIKELLRNGLGIVAVDNTLITNWRILLRGLWDALFYIKVLNLVERWLERIISLVAWFNDVESHSEWIYGWLYGCRHYLLFLINCIVSLKTRLIALQHLLHSQVLGIWRLKVEHIRDVVILLLWWNQLPLLVWVRNMLFSLINFLDLLSSLWPRRVVLFGCLFLMLMGLRKKFCQLGLFRCWAVRDQGRFLMCIHIQGLKL
jgi:hypothetical protein